MTRSQVAVLVAAVPIGFVFGRLVGPHSVVLAAMNVAACAVQLLRRRGRRRVA